MKRRRDGLLTLIAIFKIAKALLLVAGGVIALKLLHPSEANHVWRWVAEVPFEGERRLFAQALAMVTTKSSAGVAVAAFAYAALFFVEGIGLFLRKRWAEWLMIFATSALIPLEVRHVWHRPSVGAVVILVANCFIVWFLYYVLKWGKHEHDLVERHQLVETR